MVLENTVPDSTQVCTETEQKAKCTTFKKENFDWTLKKIFEVGVVKHRNRFPREGTANFALTQWVQKNNTIKIGYGGSRFSR